MAKTAKLKKRQSTVHSRAARRAVSPSIDLDKSITAPRPRSASPKPALTKPHVLAAQSAGIAKKSKNKALKRQQRIRREKGMERAADVMDKRELKVQKSFGREKTVRERKKGWEEVNYSSGKAMKLGEKKANVFGVLGEEDDATRNEREWVSDEEMPEVDGGEVQAVGEDDVVLPEASGEVRRLEVVVPASIPLPAATVEEDEML